MTINNLFDTTEVSGFVSETIVDADERIIPGECCIIHEHLMELYINEKLAMKLVCTSSNLAELIIGRMISEGYITSVDDVEIISICRSGRKAQVFLTEAASTLLEQTQAVDLQLQRLPKTQWKPEWIFELAKECVSGAGIHNATQGTHACYLSIQGKILFVCEDIGRHNALDKAIGYAAMQGIKREECILYTTGRVPTDMARKVIMARIPVLVSKSVPTNEAIEMARAYNLTLICKAWPDRYEIFHDGQPT